MCSLAPFMTAREAPRVAFSELVERGMISPGAILFDARILIMDEPTAALGPQETAQVGELIKQLKREGIGIFLISHDIHDVFDLADRVFVMKNGKVVEEAQIKALGATGLIRPNATTLQVVVGTKAELLADVMKQHMKK